MKPIVTKEMLEQYRSKHWILEGELTYNTIEAAVELLERWMQDLIAGSPNTSAVMAETRVFLASYHGTSDKEVTG